GEGLLACGQETLDGWTVGLSRDEGQSFEPLWHLTDLSPLECSPTSSTGAVCPAVWPDIARTLGAAGGEPPPNVSPPPSAAKDEGGCSLRGGSSAALSPAALSPAAPPACWLPVAAALGWLGRRRRRQGTS